MVDRISLLRIDNITTKKLKSTFVIADRSRQFADVNVVASSVVHLAEEIQTLADRRTKYKIGMLDITYGLRDDPLDEHLEIFLAIIDPLNLPNVEGLRDIAMWQSSMNWRSIGTDSGPVLTTFPPTEIEIDDWILPQEVAPQLVLALLTFSAVTTNFSISGGIEIDAHIEQRRFETKANVPHEVLYSNLGSPDQSGSFV